MKITTKLFLGLLVILSNSSYLIAQEVLPISLDESLEYSLENNVDAKNAQLEVLIAKGQIIERRSQGLPQINGTYDVTHNVAIPIVFVPNEGGFFQPEVDSDVLPLQFGVNYSSALIFSVNQMIFDGSYFVGLKAAKTYKMLTEFDKQKADIDVKETVKKAYFTVLVNEHRMEIVLANLERVDLLLAETTAMYEAGFAEKIDVSRVKVQRNNLQTEYERADAAYKISLELLKLQMGLPLSYQLQLTESLEELNRQEDLESLLAFDGDRRVEIDQLKTNLDLVDLDIKFTQSQYIPNLDFFGTYQRNGAAQTAGLIWERDRWFTGAFIGLRLSIPVFDGLLKSGQIQQKRQQMKQIENQLQFLDYNIETEKFQAKTNLRNNLRSLSVQKENRELAQEVFSMAKIKYEEGVGSNLEVVEANSSLKEAETNYFSALYDALIAKVELEKALGLL